jgi:endonuclease-3 related protein
VRPYTNLMPSVTPPRIYRLLLARYGRAGWWPAESAFEICLGAILTQNTAWSNVEKALSSLRSHGLLAFEPLHRVPASRLATLLRPSGTYKVKARRVRAFLDLLAAEYGGRVEAMRDHEAGALRRRLLTVSGIGPETADSIALYAAEKPFFVVDAYTRRIFGRLGLLAGGESYEEVQRFFMRRLPPDAVLFNDYHAQLVRLGKDHCRVRPRCTACPLDRICPKRRV